MLDIMLFYRAIFCLQSELFHSVIIIFKSAKFSNTALQVKFFFKKISVFSKKSNFISIKVNIFLNFMHFKNFIKVQRLKLIKKCFFIDSLNKKAFYLKHILRN